MSTEETHETIRFGEGVAPEIPPGSDVTPQAMGEPPAEPPPDGGGGGEPAAGPEPQEAPAVKPAGKPAAKGKKKPVKKKKKKKRPAKGKAGGKKKPPLVLFIALTAVTVAALAFVAVLLVMRFRGGGGKKPPEPPQESESQPVETEEPPPSVEPTPKPAPTVPRDMSMGEAVEYIERLNPSVLGLTGESMEEYEVYPSQRVVMVNDRSCMEIDVYSVQNPTGTNQIQGRYFLTRSAPYRLFLLDPETNTVTELPLNDGGAPGTSAEGESTPSEEGNGSETG